MFCVLQGFFNGCLAVFTRGDCPLRVSGMTRAITVEGWDARDWALGRDGSGVLLVWGVASALNPKLKNPKGL